MVLWVRPLLLSGCKGWITKQGGEGRGGSSSSSGQPHPKDRWGKERPAGLWVPRWRGAQPGSRAANRGRGGDSGARFRRPGRREPNLSPRAESDLLSTPFLPKNTFLAKSPREEGDPFPGRAAGGAAAAWHPRTRAGEKESEGSALPGLFPLLSCLSLNGRRGRHFESKERRRRRRQRQGEGRMGGRGPAQPHRQAAGPCPQPPERGEEDRGEGADPRRLTEALHRRLRRASSVLHSHPPAGEGEREREEHA